MKEIRPWKPDEITLLIFLYTQTTTPIREVAERLKRSRYSVESRITRLTLRRRQTRTPFTTRELNYLRDNVKHKTLKEIAIDLKRPYDTVRLFAMRNKIYRTSKTFRQTLLDYIDEQHRQGYRWSVIADHVNTVFGTNYSKHAVYQRWFLNKKKENVTNGTETPLDERRV